MAHWREGVTVGKQRAVRYEFVLWHRVFIYDLYMIYIENYGTALICLQYIIANQQYYSFRFNAVPERNVKSLHFYNREHKY